MLDLVKEKLSTLYYASFFLYQISIWISYTNFIGLIESAPIAATFFALLKSAALVLLALKLVLQSYRIGQLVLAGLVVVAVLLQQVLFPEGSFFTMLAFFIIAAKDIKLVKLAKIALFVQLTVLFASWAGWFVGELLPSDYRGRLFLEYRLNLGYLHPNTLGLAIFAICSTVLLVQYPRFRWSFYGLLIIGFAVSVLLAESRTIALCLAVMFIFSAMMTTSPQSGLSEKTIVRLSVGVVVFLFVAWWAVVCLYNPNNPLMSLLDRLLSNRVMLSNYYLNALPVTPFGVDPGNYNLAIGTYTGFICDNAYVKTLITYGWLPASVLMAIYFGSMMYFAANGRHPGGVLCLVLFALSGFMESYMFNFALNYSLVCVGYIIYQSSCSSDSLARNASSVKSSIAHTIASKRDVPASIPFAQSYKSGEADGPR